MEITVYTDLDSLFDTRRGILHKLALESGNSGFNWDVNFKEIYARRKYDIFNQPELGITQEKYQERFDKRTLDDFADTKCAYVLPSKLINHMFNIVRELEFGVGKMLSNSTFVMTVNLYPFELTAERQQALEETLRGAVKFNIGINFVYIPYEEQRAKFLNSFQYVFKYDLFLSQYMKNYWSDYGTCQPSNVKFIVPDVLAKQTELPEGMDAESPRSLISKLNISLGGKTTFVAIDKTIYDYR